MVINKVLVYKHVAELEEALTRLVKDLDCTQNYILHMALQSCGDELAEALIWKAQLKLLDAAQKEHVDSLFDA